MSYANVQPLTAREECKAKRNPETRSSCVEEDHPTTEEDTVDESVWDGERMRIDEAGWESMPDEKDGEGRERRKKVDERMWKRSLRK